MRVPKSVLMLAALSDIFTTTPKLDKKSLDKLDEQINQVKEDSKVELYNVYQSNIESNKRTKLLKEIRSKRDKKVQELDIKKKEIHKKYHEDMEKWKNASALKKAGKMTAKALLKTTTFTASFVAVGAFYAVRDTAKALGKAIFKEKEPSPAPTPPSFTITLNQGGR